MSVEFPATIRGFYAFCRAVVLDLEPFQRRIARAAFAEQRELVVLLPRGTARRRWPGRSPCTTSSASPRPAVYTAAASREQASLLFEAARNFAEHPALEGRITLRHLELRVPGGHLRVLAADGRLLHGLTPTLVLLDELHAAADDGVYLALRTALQKRPGARMVVISTAGQGAETALGRLRARALAQPQVSRSGPLTEAVGESVRLLEWSLDDDADLDDLRAVKAANPATWITVAGLREQREALLAPAFERFHANRWSERQSYWLPPGAWQACAGETALEDGQPVWVGVDIGGERADTAVVWVGEVDGKLHLGCEISSGETAILDAVECVHELAERFRIMEVAFDPWRAPQTIFELERRGIVASAFPQSDSRMIPASQHLYDAIVEGRLVHPDDPRLNAHVAAAIARHGRRGWRLDKGERSGNIDGLVALCMALDRASNRPEPPAFARLAMTSLTVLARDHRVEGGSFLRKGKEACRRSSAAQEGTRRERRPPTRPPPQSQKPLDGTMPLNPCHDPPGHAPPCPLSRGPWRRYSARPCSTVPRRFCQVLLRRALPSQDRLRRAKPGLATFEPM